MGSLGSAWTAPPTDPDEVGRFLDLGGDAKLLKHIPALLPCRPTRSRQHRLVAVAGRKSAGGHPLAEHPPPLQNSKGQKHKPGDRLRALAADQIVIL